MSIFMRIKINILSLINRNKYFLTSLSVFLLGISFASMVFLDFIPITPKKGGKSSSDNDYFKVSASQLIQFVNETDRTLDDRLVIFFNYLNQHYPDSFQLDTSSMVNVNGELAPKLMSGDKQVNLDTQVPEKFMEQTGAYSAIFVKKGDEFISISTSVRDENNQLPLGKKLQHNLFAYQKLMKGESYFCPVMLYGRQLIAKYFPIYDKDKKVIGALFVGVDLFEKK